MEGNGCDRVTAAATLYIAIELSRSSWLAAALGPGEQQRPSRYQLKAGDVDRLLALIGRLRGAATRVCSCYEAGYEGFWRHRRLVAAGIESRIVDPSSLQVDRRARRKKTDAIDVETILRAAVAWDRGERGLCTMIRVPDIAAEDARRTSRERERLIHEQTGHTNRIRGLLMTMGIDDFDPRRPDRRERLTTLVTGDGRPLPPRLTIEIGREIERLELVERQIAELERDRNPPAERGRPPRNGIAPHPDPASPRARIAQLQQLRGVGPTIAEVLHSEVFYRRFRNRRELTAYCGLDPTPFASGSRQHEQGISKAGNRRARHAAVELAWLWLHWQPDTALARWFRARLGAATGRLKRIMIVALARKLVIAPCSGQGQGCGGSSRAGCCPTAPSSKRNGGSAAPPANPPPPPRPSCDRVFAWVDHRKTEGSRRPWACHRSMRDWGHGRNRPNRI